jgi:branched-chain amino acid transport system ATP-binding protein
MLEVGGLHSFYGAAHVLHGVSLTVRDGEVVALLGRNGMGKTTLVRSIMGLRPPEVRAGTVRWRGQDLAGLPPHAVTRRRIAIVPQGRRLFPSLTVLEHLTVLKPARATGGGRWRGPSLSPAWPSAGPTAAASCPAGSAGCWPSPAR